MSSEIEKVVVELLPCPHCGGAAEFKRDTSSGTVYVQCSRMDCGGEWCNEADAASFWNRRTPPSSAKPGECDRCDGTGEVHRADGEWVGSCDCQPQERAGSDAGAVGTLTVSKFRGHLENTSLDYYGDLPEGSHTLYTRPQPASGASGDADSPRDVSWWVRRLKEQEAITDELSRALAESRENDARYRWLRDNGKPAAEGLVMRAPENWDAAIDAARAVAAQKPEGQDNG